MAGLALMGAAGAWAGCGGSDSSGIPDGDGGRTDGAASNVDGTIGACTDCSDANGGTTDAGGDAGSDASNAADGARADGGDASDGSALSTFCAQHSYLFCDDFDDPGAAATAAFDGATWAGEIIAPDASTVTTSTAYALSALHSGKFTVPSAFDAGQTAQLQSKQFKVPPGATHLQFGWSFRADADWTACTAGNAGWQLTALTFGDPSAPDLTLAYIPTNTVAYSGGFTKFGFLQVLDPTLPVWWSMVVDVYLAASAKTCGFNGATTYTAPCYEMSLLESDGGVIQNGFALPPVNKVDASVLGESPAITIGLGGFANPACTVYIDNVYFDAN